MIRLTNLIADKLNVLCSHLALFRMTFHTPTVVRQNPMTLVRGPIYLVQTLWLLIKS